MKTPAPHHTRLLTVSEYEDIDGLQRKAMPALPDQAWLRNNTEEMLLLCLNNTTPHTAVGTYFEKELIAVGILFDGAQTEENIKSYLTDEPKELSKAVNLKIIICHPQHRKQGHSQNILSYLEAEAVTQQKVEILATIHPENLPSINMFSRQGYLMVAAVQTKYGQRNIYTKQLLRS